MSEKRKLELTKILISSVIFIFAIMTLIEGGSTYFKYSLQEMVEHKIVPFVLIFNLMSAFVYISIGLGIMMEKDWVRFLSAALVTSIVMVYAGLALHISQGGDYMERTVYAMAIRLTFWVIISIWIWRKKPIEKQILAQVSF